MIRVNPIETQTHVSHKLTFGRRHIVENSKKWPCGANKKHQLRLRGLQTSANEFLPLRLLKMEEGF